VLRKDGRQSARLEGLFIVQRSVYEPDRVSIRQGSRFLEEPIPPERFLALLYQWSCGGRLSWARIDPVRLFGIFASNSIHISILDLHQHPWLNGKGKT